MTVTRKAYCSSELVTPQPTHYIINAATVFYGKGIAESI